MTPLPAYSLGVLFRGMCTFTSPRIRSSMPHSWALLSLLRHATVEGEAERPGTRFPRLSIGKAMSDGPPRHCSVAASPASPSPAGSPPLPRQIPADTSRAKTAGMGASHGNAPPPERVTALCATSAASRSRFRLEFRLCAARSSQLLTDCGVLQGSRNRAAVSPRNWKRPPIDARASDTAVVAVAHDIAPRGPWPERHGCKVQVRVQGQRGHHLIGRTASHRGTNRPEALASGRVPFQTWVECRHVGT